MFWISEGKRLILCAVCVDLQARYNPTPDNPTRFLLTCGGKHGGIVYDCVWGNEYPLAEYLVGDGPKALQAEGAVPPAVISLRMSLSKELVVTGADDGSVGVRSLKDPDYFIRVFQHDGDRGHVVSAVTSYEDSFLLSAGTDGLLVVHNLAKPKLLEEARVNAVAQQAREAEAVAAAAAAAAAKDPDYMYIKDDAGEGNNEVVPGFPAAESATMGPNEFTPDSIVRKPEGAEITDAAAYSIQDAKLKVRTLASEMNVGRGWGLTDG